MDKRTIYVDSDAPGVELWPSDSGLSVRNGSKGRPVILAVPTVDMEHAIAEAFFKGYKYANS